MAAVKKINKEGILEAAYNLARREGIAAITARKLAKEISCSTQPIYENFVDMGAVIEITTERINEVYGSLKTSLCKKENADYVSQTTIVCEFADSERVLFRQLVADNDSGHGLFKDTRTEKMLVETLHCDEIVADQINEEMHKYIMGQAFLVNEGIQNLIKPDWQWKQRESLSSLRKYLSNKCLTEKILDYIMIKHA